MSGILYSMAAGVIIAVQGVMNTRVSEKAGFWLTNTLVHGSGFLVSILLFMVFRDGSAGQLGQVPKGYWLGGVMGVIIVFTVMKGIGELGPSYSVAILLISQLIFAMIIDSLGLFGTPVVPFAWNRVIGVAIMIIGIVVLKWK